MEVQKHKTVWWRWEQKHFGVMMKTSEKSDWRGNRQRKDVVCKSELRLIQCHHPHSLPVLLMFLKLPKLFNFHILRLAAEREISKGNRENRERQVQVLRKETFRGRQTPSIINIQKIRHQKKEIYKYFECYDTFDLFITSNNFNNYKNKMLLQNIKSIP